MPPRRGRGLGSSACGTVWCASFHPPPEGGGTFRGSLWGPERADTGDAHGSPPECPQTVVGGLHVTLRGLFAPESGILLPSSCPGQLPFHRWNPTQNQGELLHDLELFPSHPCQNLLSLEAIHAIELSGWEMSQHSAKMWSWEFGQTSILLGDTDDKVLTVPALCQGVTLNKPHISGDGRNTTQPLSWGGGLFAHFNVLHLHLRVLSHFSRGLLFAILWTVAH